MTSILQAILECSPDAILVLDAEGRVQEWNAAATGLFGRTRAEAVGCPAAQLGLEFASDPPTDRPSLAAIERTSSDESTSVWVHRRSLATESPDPPGTVLVIRPA